MSFAAIIVAAGAGRRLGGVTPKQWVNLRGRPVLSWSVEAFIAAGAQEIVVVIGEADHERAQQGLGGLAPVRWVTGGAERIDSVRAGLNALDRPNAEAVLIHDAARPFVTVRHISALLEALATYDGALPALPVSDTLKEGDADGLIVATRPRANLWRAQTPQAFRLQPLLDAFARWPAGETPTDDAAILERVGGRGISRARRDHVGQADLAPERALDGERDAARAAQLVLVAVKGARHVDHVERQAVRGGEDLRIDDVGRRRGTGPGDGRQQAGMVGGDHRQFGDAAHRVREDVHGGAG